MKTSSVSYVVSRLWGPEEHECAGVEVLQGLFSLPFMASCTAPYKECESTVCIRYRHALCHLHTQCIHEFGILTLVCDG